MSDEPLKPCPFCGGKACIRKVPGGLGTYSNFAECGCSKCNIWAAERYTSDWDFYGEEQSAERNAIKKWNNRVDPAPIERSGDLLLDSTSIRQIEDEGTE